MQDLTRIIDFITTSNWLILLVGGMIGLLTTPLKFALGIILGGVIVAVNFHLLRRTIDKMIIPEKVSEMGRSLVGNVLMKYYIRFSVTALLIGLLMANHIVHPIGLLAGLSVCVASFFLAAILELTKIIFKEAV
ncbi:MAG: ATP synthase subunit I [Desulfobacterales bacterium]|nr:ATP synthase subunit I [Desulfobacterales bacterium]